MEHCKGNTLKILKHKQISRYICWTSLQSARLQPLPLFLPLLLGRANLPLHAPGVLTAPWPEELGQDDVPHLGRGESENKNVQIIMLLTKLEQ